MTPNFENNLAKLRETLLMMASLTDRNLGLAMRALVQREEKLAETVESTDDEIDQLEIAIDEQVISFMVEDPSTITRALNLSLVARNIERIADHAKNIAEEVYYLYRADDIRHSQQTKIDVLK